MNITTDRIITIFAKDGQYGKMYSTGISSKKQDGTYQTSYITMRFKKDVDLPNQAKIEIKQAWLVPTNDINKVAIFVNEFITTDEIVEKAHNDFENMATGTSISSDNILNDDDLLPF